MSRSGFDWLKLINDPDGFDPARLPPILRCNRIIVRKNVLNPLPVLKLYDEQKKRLATARRAFGLRERVRVFGPIPGQRELFRIERDNPGPKLRHDVDPSFRIFDPTTKLLLGRFEVREELGATVRRFWEVRDCRGAAVARVNDPSKWPQLPCQVVFDAARIVTIEPKVTIAVPTFKVGLTLGPREFIPRLLGAALAILLIAIRKHPPKMPGMPPGTGGR